MYELMIEWGLTPQQFGDISFVDIMKILEYRTARGVGEKALMESAKQSTK